MRGPFTPAGGGGGAADVSYFRNVGTGGGLGERWYPANMANNYATTTVAIVDDTLYAVPYLEVRGGTLDRIGIYLSGAAAGNFRLGIYRATSFTNLYPNNLVLDAGVVTFAAGLRAATIAQALQPNTLYWLALLAESTPANPPYALDLGGTLPMLGWTNTFTSQTWCSVAQAYGALPATFTAGAALLGTTPLMIAVRYSA